MTSDLFTPAEPVPANKLPRERQREIFRQAAQDAVRVVAASLEAETQAPDMPALPRFHTAEQALAAIVAAFYDDAKPIHAHGFRIVRADLADAIEAARAFLER